jgi:hypothetical protein
MLALMSGLSIPAVQAKSIVNAQGTMAWLAIEWGVPVTAGSNELWQGTSTLAFTGTFSGPATDVWAEIFHSNHANFRDVVTITCAVDGKPGTLTLGLVGTAPLPEYLFTGHWTILYGTGDLVNLCGQGTWGGPVNALGDFEYSGYMYFD